MARFALTAIGRDRAGIVAAVTEVLAGLGCNLEDSRMTILRGQFAIMLVLDGPDATSREQLAEALEPVAEALELLVAVRPLPDDESPAELGELVAVAIHGGDHPGIVARIARDIAGLNADVVDLATRVIGEGDEKTYVMSLTVALPLDLASAQLEQVLSVAATELGVRCTISPGDAGLL